MIVYVAENWLEAFLYREIEPIPKQSAHPLMRKQWKPLDGITSDIQLFYIMNNYAAPKTLS